jgi:regulator of cell morphogenesis and NO signaling
MSSYIVAVEATVTSDSACPRPPFMTVHNSVRMMQFEHDLAGELLRELRRITSNYTVPADGCVSLCFRIASTHRRRQE